MSSYGFRVRFKLPIDSVIQENSNELELEVLPTGSPLIMRAVGSTKIADSSTLSVRASDFSSEEEAHNYGQRTKTALMICGARCRIGIDVGKDRATSGVGKTVRESAREAGVRLLDDVHGLITYSEDLPVHFASMSARVTIGTAAAKFVEEFRRAFESLPPALSDRQLLSLELYAASKFEASLRAQFLTLISAIEALVQTEPEAAEIVRHIESLIAMTKENFKGSAKDHIVSRLGNLKTKSISNLCKEFVAKHLTPERAEQFAYYYEIRSKMLHEGQIESVDLGSKYPLLDQLVSELLWTVCTAYDRVD